MTRVAMSKRCMFSEKTVWVFFGRMDYNQRFSNSEASKRPDSWDRVVKIFAVTPPDF